jgi:DNA-binding response OmpR family regulator
LRAFTGLSQVLHSQVTVVTLAREMLGCVMEAAHAHPVPDGIQVGDLEIRPEDGLCLAAGRALTLSVREFQLLVALAQRAHRIVSRPDLYAQVWGGQLRDGDRSIDVYVHKLRVKLETALPAWAFIHTHVGFGYRLDPELSHPFHTPDTAA